MRVLISGRSRGCADLDGGVAVVIDDGGEWSGSV